MSNAYVGIGDIARKVTDIYVGVNGVARKVKNGYVGANGVARQFYASFTNPLNTDQLTLGQTGVYFTTYPSITWQVQHLDGDYAYLALYPMTETTTFGSSTTYSGSAIATKCTTFLNNTIPNVADYLEEVTVNGVTAKVFIPSKAMYETDWDWPKAAAANRVCQLNGSNKPYWTSTAYDSSYVWYVNNYGLFVNVYPTQTHGFRPAVKVRYK